jgi:aspartate dehydrogenase
VTAAPTIAIVGCGALGALIANGIVKGSAGPYRLVAVCNGTDFQGAERLADEVGVLACRTLDEMLATAPEYVVEAATGDVLRDIALPVLAAGAHLIVLSVAAFADERFYDSVAIAASQHDRTVYLSSGAIGGLDVAQAALMAGELTASMLTEKPPSALRGAPGFHDDVSSKGQTEIFCGTAFDAIAAFPKNVNVVVTLALATGGVTNVMTRIVNDPQLTRNRHTIVLEGAFGTAHIEIESAPTPTNARSSALAGYSVLAKLKSLASSIQI